APCEGPAGAVVDQPTFYAWLARADTARLNRFDEAFVAEAGPLVRGADLATASPDALRSAVASGAEPIGDPDGRGIGVLLPGHAQDESLAAPVLLENLATKATGAM